MNSLVRISAFMLLLGVLLVGCSRQEMSPVSSGVDQGLSIQSPQMLTLPSGATIVSAYLVVNENGYEYAPSAYPHTVAVHRITSPWLEHAVTWDNFGSAYDPASLGMFTSLPAFTVPEKLWNEHAIEITTLVQGWVDGTINNYGVLLEQLEVDGHWTTYVSSENSLVALRPKLIIEYSYGGSTTTQIVQRSVSGEVADAYITENVGDFNGGSSEVLYTGYIEGKKKLSLFYFDLVVEDGGCTHTIGYWKTHAGFGPQGDAVTPLLPIWLGTPGGAKSVEVKTAAQAVDYLSQSVYGTSSNGITKLYAQLLGAKLSINSGAGAGALATVIPAADAFLAQYNYMAWGSLTKDMKNQVLMWQRTLDNYNNGIIGPMHCE